MILEEIKKEKQTLQSSIERLIEEFEYKCSGCSVEEIKIERDCQNEPFIITVCAKIYIQ